jgi:hypothetical protein
LLLLEPKLPPNLSRDHQEKAWFICPERTNPCKPYFSNTGNQSMICRVIRIFTFFIAVFVRIQILVYFSEKGSTSSFWDEQGCDFTVSLCLKKAKFEISIIQLF